jgi:hypothetical protein
MRPRRLFSPEEDAVVRRLYGQVSAGLIATRIGRSVHQVRKRARRLGVNKPLKRWTEGEDQKLRDAKGKFALTEVAAALGRRKSEVSVRVKWLGLSPWRTGKGMHSGRPIEGFAKGSPVYTHRKVVEKNRGRTLGKNEIVHHVDFDKFNNAISNLVVMSRSQHRKAHSSFEQIVPALLRQGHVFFDLQTLTYRLGRGLKK